MKQNSNQKKVEKALIKKAVGYKTEETTEEINYNENGEKCSSKKKVVTKHYPPDVSAIKALLAYYGDKAFDELENMTDEELIKERDALLLLLNENNPAN